MSESALAQPEHRPAALQPPVPEERSSTLPSVPAASARPVYGNAATARVAAGEAGPAPSGLAPGSGAADLVAAQKADEVFSALGWLNHEERALAALSGHDPAMRARIQLQFRERHGRDLADFLRAQLDGDWLVRAFALLHSYNYLEQHTRLALALIPPGVRSEEVLQVLGDVAVSRRRELKVLYEYAFGTIGQGTLEKDLKAKLSGWRLQKSLALLDRDLTDADHLYFNSLAIVGTHTTEVIELIQRRWANPGRFGELIQQWDDYVTNHKHWSPDPPWTTLTLYEAMDSELSGEDWLLVKTVLVNYYKIKAGDFPGKTPEQAKQAEEEARLHVADDSLRAATTGERWWQGAGTDEAQAFRAITEIRKIWEERIARNKDAEAKKDAEANWAKRRDEIERLLAGETTKGSTEDRQVQLLLKGKTTVGGTSRADEIYLASRAAESDRVVQLVTQTWAEGKMAALISAAATPVLDPEGKTLRPSFRLELVVPVTSGETWQRVTLLTDTRFDDATRGANRLQFEIDRGDDESELKKVYQLLFMISAPGLCDAVIAAYVKERGLPAAGGASRAFLDHIRDRYASSYSYWLLLDLLEKSSDPTELYRRAHGRKAASETGLFHAIVQHFAERQDKETGEDTRAVVEESLATLSYVAQHQQGDPALATMQRLAGAADVKSLAAKEYQGFTARLDRLRAQEQAIAEAIATAIELAVEAALTIATAGVAGGALLASLASTVAGMVAREALLGQDYTLTSRENAERLVAVFATAGLGHLGGELAKEALGAERVATRAGQFVQHASSELMSQAGAVATKGAFSETGLTGGDLSATAISGFASVLGAGTTGVLKAGLAHDASLAAKLTANVRAHLAGGAVTSLGGLASELTASGVGDLTAAEIAAMGGKRLGETAVRGTLAGLRDTAVDLVAERRESAKYRSEEAEAERTAKAASSAAATPVPREYDNVLLLDVTPSQFEQVLAKLDGSTPAAREVARRIRSGELHVTMTPEGFTPSDAGRATAKEIYVQWSPSAEETASTLVHEATHQADPALTRPGASRSEIEATARVAEYEFRAQQGLEPADAAERTYRTALADAQARGLPWGEALAVARAKLVDAMRADPTRHGVEGAAGEPPPTGPPASPPKLLPAGLEVASEPTAPTSPQPTPAQGKLPEWRLLGPGRAAPPLTDATRKAAARITESQTALATAIQAADEARQVVAKAETDLVAAQQLAAESGRSREGRQLVAKTAEDLAKARTLLKPLEVDEAAAGGEAAEAARASAEIDRLETLRADLEARMRAELHPKWGFSPAEQAEGRRPGITPTLSSVIQPSGVRYHELEGEFKAATRRLQAELDQLSSTIQQQVEAAKPGAGARPDALANAATIEGLKPKPGGRPFDVTTGLEITTPDWATDHIVSRAELAADPRFARLTPLQREEMLLGIPENYLPMTTEANSSKGSLTVETWIRARANSNQPLPDAMVEALRTADARARKAVEERFEHFLGK